MLRLDNLSMPLSWDMTTLTEAVLRILENQDLYHAIKKNTHCPDKYLPDAVIEEIEWLLEGKA